MPPRASTSNTPRSPKSIPARDRLIVPLDVPTVAEARQVVERLGDACTFYKVGLQLFMTGGYWELVAWLRERQKQVFVDLKFFDVPQTVEFAVRQLAGHDAAFCTVHGNDEILRAAVRAGREAGTKILAVTVLTSLDQGDIDDLGFRADIPAIVLSRARRALDIGCAGVVSSGIEAPAQRGNLGEKFLIIMPGIRPVANVDDQKRTVDVEQAFTNGADYIVVGRPILNAPDPRAAAEDVQSRIARVFA